ncbi:MAG: alpha/beta hydrolase [Lachnospiraceae bacterium]|nr:alpha/beta hydrolase [Lachnospiraceae bacterium]
MTEKILQTDKGTVHYWSSTGRRPGADTLFFLHGLTADHTMFEAQTAYFGEAYDLLAWDAPGHGASRPFEPFSFEDAANYMRDILDEAGAAQVILIGQSLGGYFAQSFIKRFPERVKGFVSIGSTPYGSGYYSALDVWIVRQIEWMAALYPFGLLKKAMAKQVSATQAGYDNMMRMLAPYEKRELCRLMGIGYAGFLEDNCDLDIPCPVLLLLGEKDRTGKVRQYDRVWARRTGFPLCVIRGAAHNANVDRPGAVNMRILRFVQDL